jgi:hypothetical protein
MSANIVAGVVTVALCAGGPAIVYGRRGRAGC